MDWVVRILGVLNTFTIIDLLNHVFHKYRLDHIELKTFKITNIWEQYSKI